MEDNSKEILAELKSLNKSLSEELEREKSERDLQATTDSSNAEKSAEELALKEQVQTERFEKISTYIDQESEKQVEDEQFRNEVLAALNNLGQEGTSDTTLTEINTKLGVLVDHYENAPELEKKEEVSYFTDLLIIVFLLVFVPSFLAYRGLSNLFDSAMA